MNKPREGHRPNLPLVSEVDLPDSKVGLIRKVESGLAEVRRDSLRNRFLADRNGWTEDEYWHWVETGDAPIRSVVKETPSSRSNEIDDDERLHR